MAVIRSAKMIPNSSSSAVSGHLLFLKMKCSPLFSLKFSFEAVFSGSIQSIFPGKRSSWSDIKCQSRVDPLQEAGVPSVSLHHSTHAQLCFLVSFQKD